MQLARGGEDRKRRSCNLLVDNCHATYVWPSRRMSLAWCPLWPVQPARLTEILSRSNATLNGESTTVGCKTITSPDGRSFKMFLRTA